MSSDETSGSHLFVSYAVEDWPLAEWLTRKLTAEGFRVWCDRFKLLGGESYTRDIDVAIKTRTFRFLALLSKQSLTKPNPTKERTLALNIARERGIDFLIPLNVDGLKPTELDWMTSDLTFIPFHPSWAKGLKQLLDKLRSVDAPRPLADGMRIAAETFYERDLLSNKPETVHLNLLRVLKMPKAVKRFEASRKPTEQERKDLARKWPHYYIDAGHILAFQSPPSGPLNDIALKGAGALHWPSFERIDKIQTANLIPSLLSKSVRVKCLEKGLAMTPNDNVVYFPKGLLPSDRLHYHNHTGKRTWILAAGIRHHNTRPLEYSYHLSPDFRIRQDLLDSFTVQLRVRLYLTELDGGPLSNRSANARRKRICANWWNLGWLSRHLAICEYLSGGSGEVAIGRDPSERIVLDARLLRLDAPNGIDETLLETPPTVEDAEAGLIET
jgi:hypothetical protein